MLSVCIPVYNHHISKLVNNLHNQGKQLEIPFEILIIDDASDKKYDKENCPLIVLDHVRYEALKHNIGRSKIRNLLAIKARYPQLLFLDCDIEIKSQDFLRNYLDAGKDGSVVCGGHIYQSERPPHPYVLHWLAGSKRETKTAIQRQKKPHHSFMTSSFLVPYSLLYQLPFNEEISGYGHEDTLYGYQLMKRGVAVKHIDNPVVHEGLEPGPIFIRKTSQSLVNLIKICKMVKNDPEFISMVRVLMTYYSLKQYKLHRPFAILHRLLEKYLIKHLVGKHPRLWMLDMHKLGIICQQN